MSENVQKGQKISGLPEGRQLKQSEIDFMKLIESQNLERVRKLQKTRRNNFITGKENSYQSSTATMLSFFQLESLAVQFSASTCTLCLL